MYERILVPTDGSENAGSVADQAVNLAEAFDAEIHALYVINTGALPSPEIEFREDFVSTGEEIGKEAVGAIADDARAKGVDVTTAIVRGTPYEAILDYADDHDVDLIVMGTHGRSGLSHFLLGSVAERVIRRSETPVLLVRTGQ